MERSLSLELVRVTETAALAAARWMGIENVNRVLFMEDIIKGEDAFFAATGVTDGEILKEVQYKGDIGTTHSVVMRAKSGTLRFIEGEHSLEKKLALVNSL